MRFNGEWLQCDDGIARPIIRGEILARDGTLHAVPFLVDTGADRSVISAEVLESLELPHSAPVDNIGGIGGIADSVIILAALRLLSDGAQWVTFRGEYAACTQYEILDMSVLGRDVLNHFAVIVDRPANIVAIVGGAHSYSIQQQ
jgi:hypothetical protein